MRKSLLVIGLATFSISGIWTLPAGAAESARPVVVLYGDSLAWEARDHFAAGVSDGTTAEVVLRTFGGTALCDWLPTMADDAAHLRPAVVVIEFSGNRFTPCMHDAAGTMMGDGDAYMKYLADARAAVRIFSSVGTHVVFTGAPVSRSMQGFKRGRILNVLYEWIARTSPAGTVSYVDAGTAVQQGDDYVDALPCLPGEPCPDPSGMNVVRSWDGVHLCPGDDTHRDPTTRACLVWSSGAYRYGRAMAAPVAALLPR